MARKTYWVWVYNDQGEVGLGELYDTREAALEAFGQETSLQPGEKDSLDHVWPCDEWDQEDSVYCLQETRVALPLSVADTTPGQPLSDTPRGPV